jgi:hypothetical protein
MTSAQSREEMKTEASSPGFEAFPFLLMTSGIGAYWVAAGGGRVAAVGLTLVFIGDVIRLLMRLRGGPVPRPGASSFSSAPFIVMGLVANEGLWRLLNIHPAQTLVEGMRLAAGLFALVILWSAPPRETKNIWKRILGLQAGIAQALILGIPLSWLVRPLSLVAGKPEVAGSVSVGAGLLWLLCAIRMLHQHRIPLRATLAILLLSLIGWIFLGWIWWALRNPVLGSWDIDLQIPAFIALVVGAIATTLHWILVWRREPESPQH